MEHAYIQLLYVEGPETEKCDTITKLSCLTRSVALTESEFNLSALIYCTVALSVHGFY